MHTSEVTLIVWAALYTLLRWLVSNPITIREVLLNTEGLVIKHGLEGNAWNVNLSMIWKGVSVRRVVLKD